MVKLLEIYAPFAPDRFACVVAIQSPRHGFFISRQQFLQAKRKLKVPDWSTVYLRPNGVVKQLVVISYNFDHDEVITCAG